MASSLRGLRTGVVVPPRGTHIYAYRHFLTNQVVYSLSRSLDNNSALKQLAFAGKKSVPRALRKDHWKPFFTVNFDIAQQGLNAYKKLREWRLLHELSWNPKELPDITRTTAELDDLREANEERDELGGWRKGGPRRRLTEMKRKKKKMIMSQAENSVADLAAVLLEQEKKASADDMAHAASYSERITELVKCCVDEPTRAAKTMVLNKKIAEMLARIRTIKEASGSKHNAKTASKVSSLNSQVSRLREEAYFVEHVRVKLFEEARRRLAEEKSKEFAMVLQNLTTVERNRSIKKLRELKVNVEDVVSARQGRNKKMKTSWTRICDEQRDYALAIATNRLRGSGGPRSTKKQPEIEALAETIAKERIQSMTHFTDRLLASRQETGMNADRERILAEAKLRFERDNQSASSLTRDGLKFTAVPGTIPDQQDITVLALEGASDVMANGVRMKLPVEGFGSLTVEKTIRSLHLEEEPRWRQKNPMSMSGVSVDWANPLDAEFGKLWPQEVQHNAIGFHRNTAPGPSDERVTRMPHTIQLGANNEFLGTIDVDAMPRGDGEEHAEGRKVILVRSRRKLARNARKVERRERARQEIRRTTLTKRLEGLQERQQAADSG